MYRAGKFLRWVGIGLGVLALCLVAVFALLQTRIAKDWLAREVAGAISDPDFTVAIDVVDGIVPFRMTVQRIDIGDRDGIYLTLRDTGLDISASALLAGKAHIRALTIAEADMARSSTAPSTTPLMDYLKVPHLPVPIALDRLLIGKLSLAAPVLGESIVATIDGSAELAGGRAQVSLDLHRIDGAAGKILLGTELAGDPPVLSLGLDAAEPTGVVLDRLLARTDRLPLALSVNGSGPLTDWHGRVDASGGSVAHVAADLSLAALRRGRGRQGDGPIRNWRGGKDCRGGFACELPGALGSFGIAGAAARRLGHGYGFGDRHREPAIARPEPVS